MPNFMIDKVFHLEILSHLILKACHFYSLTLKCHKLYEMIAELTKAPNSITTINNPVQCPVLYSAYNMPIYIGVINENNNYKSIIYDMNSLPSGYVSR